MALHRPLSHRLLHIHPPEELVVLISALVVGLGTGLGAVCFIRLMGGIEGAVHRLAAAAGGAVGPPGGAVARLAAMAAAGLAVGVVVERWAREARGHGVPEVMEAEVVAGGRIRARVAVLKLLCSSVTIGVGGSAGREGPIVQVGAALGSIAGQLGRFGTRHLRTLVACGAAGGIAATFNAPIAGAIFALEIVLGSFTVGYFGAVVISSVAASVVARVFLSASPAFVVPAYPLHSLAEIPLYCLLGLLAGIVAATFIRLLYGVEASFDGWRVWPPLRYAVGMALTGTVALVLPGEGVLGPGLHAIGNAIARNLPLSLGTMAALLLLKLVATSLTLGSGNSGGIFAPSLFMGAILGGMVGSIAHTVWPGVAIDPGAYAIAGMAAVFAGAARAPITAVLIVFEMSGDYALILPLMLATVVATSIAQVLSPESIYTMKLVRRGIHLQGGRDVELLSGLSVAELMEEEVHGVASDMDLATLSDLFAESGDHCLAVLREDGALWGMVRSTDLDRAVQHHVSMGTRVSAIGVPRAKLVVTHPDESAADALTRMGVHGLEILPVLDRDDPTQLLGLLHRDALVRAYSTTVSRRQALHHRAQEAGQRRGGVTEFVEVELAAGDRAVGHTVRDLAATLPEEAILIAIHRDGRTLIPHGATPLVAGDRITAFAHAEDVAALLAALRGVEAEGAAAAEEAGR